MGVAVIVW